MLVLEVDVTTVGVGDKFVLTMSANVLPLPLFDHAICVLYSSSWKRREEKNWKGILFPSS